MQKSPFLHLGYLLSLFYLLCIGCNGQRSTASSGSEPERPKSALRGKLILTGSSTVAPLCLEIGKAFEKLHPEVRVDVQTGGSSRGMADARTGVAQIGMVSRGAKPDEHDLTFHTVALDGICIILHKDNPVATLSDPQIVDIYTGKFTNWIAIGGKDLPITVVSKVEGRSTLELFTHYFKLKNPDIKAHVLIGDNEQAIKTIAGNPNAIGYVSIGTAEYNSKIGTRIKLLPVGGVAATLANVKEGKFPLSRPLSLVTKPNPSGLTKAFLDFACSKQINRLVEEQFFVPIHD